VRSGDFFRLLGRAARRRCPVCGGPIWDGWLTMRTVCPTCGTRLDRGESDHFYGAYMLNFVAAELMAAGVFVVALLVTWPTPPWDALLWGAIAMAVIAPLALYPVTKTLWIGIDIMMRPERAGEEI
jgi:uncharacterized protein (DUF983 family)